MRIVLLASLLLSSCSSSPSGRLLNIAVVGSGVADVVSTQQAVASGCCREANPIMGEGWVRQSLLKGLGVSSVIALAHAVEIKGKPVLGHVMRGLAIAIWGAVSWQNYQVAQR